VDQARSEIKQAEAAIKVAQAMRDSARALLDESAATVERVEADVERWKSELARITELAARQAVTEKLADETRNKFSAAQAARKEVAAKIKSSQAHVAESEALVAKADADLGAAQAKLAFAEADRDRVGALLGFSEIHAPFDGIVAARHVDTGHLVNVGSSAKDALLVVVNTDVVRVFVDAPEIDAVHIQPAAVVTIRTPSLAASDISGTVTRTTWVLNQATRTLRVEIDVPNESGRLRPGMYAHARIKVAERMDALTLPKTALMSNAGQMSCWKIEADGKLVRQPVQTGLEADGDVEIITGLTGDEELIGVNAAAFREGQAVDKVAAKK
jgi:RND family efflux transporter MFP subunit